jgi:hypothetical protein
MAMQHLPRFMFAGAADAGTKAADAAKWFGDAATFLSHGRPVRRDEAREHGIKVVDLEDDPDLQDAVLSVHHAALLSMSNIPIVKLIENNRDRRWLQVVQMLTLAAGPVVMPPASPPPGGPPAGPQRGRALGKARGGDPGRASLPRGD